MALVISNLKSAIKAAFDAQATKKENPESARQDLSDKLAVAIDNYIKSATVTVAKNIPVSTTGSATAQTGFTTSTGIGTIS
jgi:TFIIF-interacting CTD phosphatase-like protein